MHDMMLTLSEMHSRNAFTIVITDCLHKLDTSKIDLPIQVMSMKDFTPLISVVVF